jgi:ethanolamine utilization protein EutQ (cupin superfamily)
MYTVTFETSKIAIDLGEPKEFDLQGALAHACQLLLEGKLNVTIKDDNGHQISGGDLVACCKGDKTISPDLFRARP